MHVMPRRALFVLLLVAVANCTRLADEQENQKKCPANAVWQGVDTGVSCAGIVSQLYCHLTGGPSKCDRITKTCKCVDEGGVVYCASGHKCVQKGQRPSVQTAEPVQGLMGALKKTLLGEKKQQELKQQEFARDWQDKRFVQYLAACATDVYTFSGSSLEPLERKHEKKKVADPYVSLEAKQEMGDDFLTQWGVYRILRGGKTGRAILALRGTEKDGTDRDLQVTLAQDISLLRRGHDNYSYFLKAVDEAEEVARRYNVSYVTGHSLGCALAEIVATRLKIGGAGFNGPGICDRVMNLCEPGYSSIEFEVYLTKKDAVSLWYPDDHIAKPKWMETDFAESPNTHSMDYMKEYHIGSIGRV